MLSLHFTEEPYSATGSSDNGRGMAADVDSINRGAEFWSSNDRTVRSCVDGSAVSSKSQSQCFRLYWDGDVCEELFDGKYDSDTETCSPALTKYNGTGSVKNLYVNGQTFASYNAMTCNTTKATPNLIADIFGDWREEIICWDSTDDCSLLIFTSTEPTSYRVPTLMHDHVYRMGVAWENVCYNQPPHLGYFLPDYIDTYGATTGIKNIYSVNDGWIRMFDANSLEVNSDGSHATTIGIYDISGREQWSESLNINGTQIVELPQLPKGVYMLKATSGTDLFNKKFMAK